MNHLGVKQEQVCWALDSSQFDSQSAARSVFSLVYEKAGIREGGWTPTTPWQAIRCYFCRLESQGGEWSRAGHGRQLPEPPTPSLP